MLTLGEFTYVVGPLLIEGSLGNARLGDVIDHEGLIRMAIHKLDGLRQVLVEDEDVVEQVVLLKTSNALIEGVAQDEVIVGLVVHHVAHALELLVSSKALEVGLASVLAQRHPTDHAPDLGILFRKVQQELSLLDDLAGLHGDTARGSIFSEGGLHFGTEEVAANDGVVVGHPHVVRVVDGPQVVVAVNFLCHGVLVGIRIAVQ